MSSAAPCPFVVVCRGRVIPPALHASCAICLVQARCGSCKLYKRPGLPAAGGNNVSGAWAWHANAALGCAVGTCVRALGAAQVLPAAASGSAPTPFRPPTSQQAKQAGQPPASRWIWALNALFSAPRRPPAPLLRYSVSLCPEKKYDHCFRLVVPHNTQLFGRGPPPSTRPSTHHPLEQHTHHHTPPLTHALAHHAHPTPHTRGNSKTSRSCQSAVCAPHRPCWWARAQEPGARRARLEEEEEARLGAASAGSGSLLTAAGRPPECPAQQRPERSRFAGAPTATRWGAGGGGGGGNRLACQRGGIGAATRAPLTREATAYVHMPAAVAARRVLGPAAQAGARGGAGEAPSRLCVPHYSKKRREKRREAAPQLAGVRRRAHPCLGERTSACREPALPAHAAGAPGPCLLRPCSGAGGGGCAQ